MEYESGAQQMPECDILCDRTEINPPGALIRYNPVLQLFPKARAVERPYG